MAELNNIHLQVPANLCYSALVRNMADDILGFLKINNTWRNRLKLVVDELFMNAVKYGSTKNKSWIYITLSYHDALFHFTIEDDGAGKKTISAEKLQNKVNENQKNNDPNKLSGRGLSMISASWSDELKIEKSKHGGIKITFSKKIEANLS